MRIGDIFSSLKINASALSVQRRRMNVVARNLANVNTTRTEEGGPYRRETVVVREKEPQGEFGKMMDNLRVHLNHTNRKHMDSWKYPPAADNDPGGAEVDGILQDENPPKMVYDPQHPDADADGYVAMPNINPVTEMVEIISASRAYEANLTAIDADKKIVKKSLEI
jgi:flagellar basal-body rod protein FlgC